MISAEFPKPILFNCWKHHAEFIRLQINSLTGEEGFNLIIKNLLVIGESRMDIYTGSLSIEEIANDITARLADYISSKNSYRNWISEDNKDYRTLQISDSSSWTFRMGNDEQRYVHVHPSRYSVNSIRVKATTLKSAIAFLAWEKLKFRHNLNLEEINYVRKTFLFESPLKSLTTSSGIVKIILLLHGK